MNIQLQEIKNIFIKNRLTEGVDYKRYEWLKGDGSAYIDTKHNTNEDLDWSTRAYLPYTGLVAGLFLLRNGNTAGIPAVSLILANQSSGLNGLRIGNNSYELRNAEIKTSIDVEVKFNGANVNVNNVDYTITKGEVVNANLQLFGYKNITVSQFTTLNVKCNYFKLGEVLNLVPCQLLKSIPATLDANNIARAAGECGMYDSISGKFYGNVASTGTFTVEGEVEPETHTGLQQIYQNKLIEGVDYETADWLKMDIPESTLVDMMALPINSNNVEFKRNWIQITNSEYFRTSNYIYYITDYGDTHDLHPIVWKITSSQMQYIGNINLGLGLHTIISDDSRVTISANSNVASLQWYGNPITYMTFNSMMVFNTNTTHLTSSIKIDGVVRYVPCQLLRSIPRNLDAQCKERVAGECGMIDLISGKFYGNVASSGTFTVENDNNE